MARAKIGLALGAGGTRGTAHVGVLKVLDEAGVPIDVVSGASVGALYGASYCLGRTPQEMETALERTSARDVAGFFRDRLHLGARNSLAGRFYNVLRDVRFEDLLKPFAVVASDVMRRRPVIIREGNVLEAVQASIAIPILARPVRLGDGYYLDGGMWEPAPAQAARELGAERVIAVVLGESEARDGWQRRWGRRALRLTGGHWSRERPNLLTPFLFRLHTMVEEAERSQPADVMICPAVRDLNPNSPFHLREAMRRGEQAAWAALPQIEALLAGAKPRPRPVRKQRASSKAAARAGE